MLSKINDVFTSDYPIPKKALHQNYWGWFLFLDNNSNSYQQFIYLIFFVDEIFLKKKINLKKFEMTNG